MNFVRRFQRRTGKQALIGERDSRLKFQTLHRERRRRAANHNPQTAQCVLAVTVREEEQEQEDVVSEEAQADEELNRSQAQPEINPRIVRPHVPVGKEAQTLTDHAHEPEGGVILRKYSSVGSSHPFDGTLKEPTLAQNCHSNWNRLPHTIHSHAHQLNDHTIVHFASDRDAAIFYVYDSRQFGFEAYHKYEAVGMHDCERYETAAGHSATNTIYAVTSVGKYEPMRIIRFDLDAMRWEVVATRGIFVGHILGAVMVEDNVFILSDLFYWTYSVTSGKVTRLGACGQLIFDLSTCPEVNLFYLRNAGKVLLVVHGQGMCTIDVNVQSGRMGEARHVYHPKPNRTFPTGFGCVVTNDCAHVLMFLGCRIFVIDTTKWRRTTSKAEYPADFKGGAAMFTWIMKSTYNRIVDGYAHRLSDDVRRLIKAYVSHATRVHLFMRGNGHHWARKLQSILN